MILKYFILSLISKELTSTIIFYVIFTTLQELYSTTVSNQMQIYIVYTSARTNQYTLTTVSQLV